MKTRTKIIITILLMASFSDMQAQIKAGYIFGLNLSTLTIQNRGLISSPETVAGIHFGGIMEVPLKWNFTLEPGFLLSAKGANYLIDTVDYSISPNYIEVPVNVVFGFGSENVKILLFAGPYIAFGIGGYKLESEKSLKYLSFGSGENKDLKSFDAGFNFGAGISVKGFHICARYGTGLINISPSPANNSEVKNKVIGISICSLIEHK